MSLSEAGKKKLTDDLHVYRPVVEQYKNNSTIEQGSIALDNILSGFTRDEQRYIFEFVNLLLNTPIMYIKLLLTFVYWKTWKKVEDSEVIEKFFSNFADNDDERLKNSLGTFNNPYSKHRIQDFQRVGRIWYNDYFKPTGSNPETTMTMIQNQINILVFVADHLMGNNVGTKALQSCEIAAFSASTNNFVNFLGCISGLVSPSDARCQAIQGTIQQFMENLERGRGNRK